MKLESCSITAALNAIVEGRLSAEEFSRIYWDLTQHHFTTEIFGRLDEEAENALLSLRSCCDVFEPDPQLLVDLRNGGPSPEYWLDDKVLLERAKRVLDLLVEKGFVPK